MIILLKNDYYSTAEAVTRGHPDKICDQIADAILDAYIKEDPNAHVAVEVAVHFAGVIVMGEVSSLASIDMESIVRKTIIEIGYDRDELGFNGYNCPIQFFVHQQSSDILLGLNQDNLGAGDQGIMFGFATNETEEQLPLSFLLAHQLTQKLEDLREKKILPFLRPDGKAQITLFYQAGIPVCATNIVIACQHEESVSTEQLRKIIEKEVVRQVVPSQLITEKTEIFINTTGRFVLGGPIADSGLTGRKLMVDTYGCSSHHGGGSFSGKDCTKVDRTASYYARYVAKHIVRGGLADQVEIQVSYAIGKALPTSINIDTFGTNHVPEEKIRTIITNCFDFRPSNMIQELQLKRPIYLETSQHGHFGNQNFPWEKLSKLETVKSLISH